MVGTAWLAFFAGLGLGGAIGDLVDTAVHSVSTTAGKTAGSFLGIGVGGIMFIIAVIVCLELWHTMKPSKRKGGVSGGDGMGGGGRGKATMFTVGLALVAPLLFVAAGGVFGDVVHLFNSGVNGLGGTAGSLLRTGG